MTYLNKSQQWDRFMDSLTEGLAPEWKAYVKHLYWELRMTDTIEDWHDQELRSDVVLTHERDVFTIGKLCQRK